MFTLDDLLSILETAERQAPSDSAAALLSALDSLTELNNDPS